jgi:transcriptional regulator with XRE-family HTH domain
MLLGHAVDNTQLSHLEHGRGYPRLPLLCALADVLGRDIDEFVEDI